MGTTGSGGQGRAGPRRAIRSRTGARQGRAATRAERDSPAPLGIRGDRGATDPGPASWPRGLSVLAMIFALFMLCGIYMRLPAARTAGQPVPPDGHARAGRGHRRRWPAGPPTTPGAEIYPLAALRHDRAIVYRQELAVLLSGVLAWIIVVAIGHGCPGFWCSSGTATVASLNVGQHPQPQQADLRGAGRRRRGGPARHRLEPDRQPAARPGRC